MLEIWAWEQSGAVYKNTARMTQNLILGALKFRPKNFGSDEASNPRFNSFRHVKNKINSNKIYKLVSYLPENTRCPDIWCPSNYYCEDFRRFGCDALDHNNNIY